MLVCLFLFFSFFVFHAFAKSDKTVSNSVLYGLFTSFHQQYYIFCGSYI